MHLATPRILSAAARRRFVATLAGAAAALALMTVAAAPARADDGRDLARALAAIAAVAIIAKTIDNNKKRSEPVPVEPAHGWGHSYPGHGKPGYGRPGQGWDRDRGQVLPAQCAIEFPGQRGRPHVVYSEPCLRRSGINGRLPRGCEQQVRIQGRQVAVYPQACLTDVGFRLERQGRPQPHHVEPRREHRNGSDRY
ncbi:MAG: hypothetical protein ACK4GO_13025 [Gemmobacter sp.]